MGKSIKVLVGTDFRKDSIDVATAEARGGGVDRFEATSRSLALRPGDSPPLLRWRCR
jgi:hypothetical protein